MFFGWMSNCCKLFVLFDIYRPAFLLFRFLRFFVFYLLQVMTYNDCIYQFNFSDLFRLCPPPPSMLCAPQLQGTYHYIVNHHVKVWHMCLWVGNNKRPQSWWAKRKRSNFSLLLRFCIFSFLPPPPPPQLVWIKLNFTSKIIVWILILIFVR